MQVLRAIRTAGKSERERLARHASNNAVSSSRLIARPTSSQTRSILTSGCIDAQRRFLRRIARNVPTSRLIVLGAAPFSRRSACLRIGLDLSFLGLVAAFAVFRVAVSGVAQTQIAG